MIDPAELGKQMADIVREATAPLLRRIDDLEKAIAAHSSDRDVASAITVDDIRPMLQEMVDAIPRPSDGKSVTVEDIVPLIQSEVEKAVDAIPKPKDGKDADPVEITIEDITKAVLEAPEAIRKAVSEYLSENPPASGKDGIGQAGQMIDRDGNLISTMTDGTVINLGPVVGKDGAPGKDGRDGADGFNLEDLHGEYDPERGYILRFVRGDYRKELVLPYMQHSGFWREGISVKAGATATHDGSLWIALRETKSKPCLENSKDWILAARKGRDGRDGKNGIDATKPVKVDEQ